MMRTLDDYIIDDQAQKWAEKYQLKTRKTNFHLAIICLVVSLIAFTPLFIRLNLYFKKTNFDQIQVILGGTFLYVLSLYIIISCKKLNKKYEKLSEISEFNPLRKSIFIRKIRYLYLFLSAYTIFICACIFYDLILFSKIDFTPSIVAIILIFPIIFTLVSSGLYFSACTPIPGHKLRQLKKKKPTS